MLKEIPLANTSALVVGIYYVICRLLASLAPDALKALSQSWFHTFDFSSLPATNLGLGTTLFGFLTAVGLSWITGYLFVFVYNKLSR